LKPELTMGCKSLTAWWWWWMSLTVVAAAFNIHSCQ
jgi:hypothetical protein